MPTRANTLRCSAMKQVGAYSAAPGASNWPRSSQPSPRWVVMAFMREIVPPAHQIRLVP